VGIVGATASGSGGMIHELSGATQEERSKIINANASSADIKSRVRQVFGKVVLGSRIGSVPDPIVTCKPV
jgi:hypothetical protein